MTAAVRRNLSRASAIAPRTDPDPLTADASDDGRSEHDGEDKRYPRANVGLELQLRPQQHRDRGDQEERPPTQQPSGTEAGDDGGDEQERPQHELSIGKRLISRTG